MLISARLSRSPAAFGLSLMGSLLLSACAGGPAPVPAAAPSDAPAFKLDSRRQTIPVAASITQVSARNPHGDIRVRTGRAGEVGLITNLQLIEPTPVPAEIVQVVKGSSLRLEVRYPWGEPVRRPGGDGYDHTRGRADVALYVPPSMALELETFDGRVQVRRATADLSVRTRSGIVDVSSAAGLNVVTDSGKVVARQESGSWSGEASIRSGSGDVVIAVPVFGDFDLRVEAAAAISVDAGMSLVPQRDSNGRWTLQHRYGAGGRILSAISASGAVHLVPVIPLSSSIPGPPHGPDTRSPVDGHAPPSAD